MEYLQYAKHYYNMDLALPFFLVSLAGLVVVMGIILIMARISQEFDKGSKDQADGLYDADIDDIDNSYTEDDETDAGYMRQAVRRSSYKLDDSDNIANVDGADSTDDPDGYYNSRHARRLSRSRSRNRSRESQRKAFEFIESFYELVFASTSILLLLSLYYIIGDRINVNTVNQVWNNYKDWLLLLFLLVSMILNRILDKVFVPIRWIDAKQRASLRLESSIYVVLILLYIRFIYQSYNYESLIIYFVMLVVGRLLYFDVTWEGFKSDISGIVRNFPFLVLIGGYSAVVVWYGFNSGFLLKANGVLVSTLIAHLFMDVCIVLFDRLRVWKLFLH